MNLVELKSSLDKAKGQRQVFQDQLETETQNVVKYEERFKNFEELQMILQVCAKETQDQFVFHLTDIVQLALDACFPNKYQIKIDFVLKNNKSVVEIYFMKEGGRVEILDADGGGLVNIVCFALRIALWSISRTDNCMVLDEPFHFLSRDLHEAIGEVLKQLSKKLKIQFIMVSHASEMVEIADKVFKVKMIEDKSIVMEA